MMAGSRKRSADLDAFIEAQQRGAGANAAPQRVTPTPGPVIPIVRAIDEVGASAFDELQRAREDLAKEREKWAAGERAGIVVIEVDTDRIIETNYRDRDERGLTGPEIAELALNISERGQLTPVELRPSVDHPGKYEVVYGHRRVRACATLKRPVRALVRPSDDLELVRRMEIENSKRVDLSPIEKARKYQALIEGGVMTQADLVREFGISRGHVSQLLTIGKLPGAVLAAFDDPRRLTQAQAYALACAMRDPALLERATREAPRIQESDLPIPDRLAILKDPARSVDGWTMRVTKAEHRGRSGQVIAALSQKGDRRAIRFPADIEAEFVEYLWESVPKLREEFERGRR